MDEQKIRQMIREELAGLIKSDRYTFEKHLQLLDGKNIQTGIGTGTKIGLSSSEKLAFWGATPVDRPSAITEYTQIEVTDNGATTNNTKINNNFSLIQNELTAIINLFQELGIHP